MPSLLFCIPEASLLLNRSVSKLSLRPPKGQAARKRNLEMSQQQNLRADQGFRISLMQSFHISLS